MNKEAKAILLRDMEAQRRAHAMLTENVHHLQQCNAIREAALNEVVAARNTCGVDLGSLWLRIDQIWATTQKLMKAQDEKHATALELIEIAYSTEARSYEEDKP
jgi:hypothetical protein